jgi:hypothetical protein
MPQEILTPEQTIQDDQQETIRKQRLERRTVLSDCRLMLRYALDESCQVPVSLGQDIAKIDAFLIAAGQKPLSEVPLDLIKTTDKPGTPVAAGTLETETLNEIILRVHNALSSLVAPATALSLRATDPDLTWFGMPRVVQWALWGAAFFMVWFLICVPKPELQKPKEQTSGETAHTTLTPSPPQATPSPSSRNP